MIYDIVIIGGGAAGLFAGISADKKLKKIVLEKNKKAGMKVLLSGGERANVSNMDIEPTRDYFTQNKNFLHSIFSQYTNWDIMEFFAKNNVEIVEEDRSRLILKSGDSKELLACLLDNLRKNNCELKIEQDVIDITLLEKSEKIYKVSTREKKEYFAKNVILSSGGKSFAQVGTTGEGYNIAEKLGLKVVPPYRTLSGMATKTDISELSGVTLIANMQLKDTANPKARLYQEYGPILCTHFGVSGPLIHNVSNAIGEYLNKILDKQDMPAEQFFEKYICDNLYLEITLQKKHCPKRAVKFFSFEEEETEKTTEIFLQNWRSWKEAKATGGGISTDELDNHMQSKEYPGLYIIGEVVDVTGKTGGFNLQWGWSSGYVAAKNITDLKSI